MVLGTFLIQCLCGSKYYMGTLGANCKSEQQRDVYAWEDDVGITEVDEAQVSDDEDDAPLSSFN
jgi:hypothetical protein